MVATGDSDGLIRFWDAATGKEVGRRKGHQSGIHCLALSADGKKLVSGGWDGTALVWDVPALQLDRMPAVNLQTAQLEALWKDLAGEDAAKAHRAMHTLAVVPAQALPVLQERLKPVAVPDPQRIAQLIADLDNKQFATRQKAEEELEKLGELADPALKKVLQGQPPLEIRQRVERLREKIVTPQDLSGEQLQALRALRILEDIGTTEARELLGQLCQGAAGARQTREAKTALARLAKRPG